MSRNGEREQLQVQFQVVEVQASIAAAAQLQMAREWRLTEYLVGGGSAVLAALAGTAVLSQLVNALVVAALAIASAILSALNTFIRPSDHAGLAAGCANKYLAIRHRAAVAMHLERDQLSEAFVDLVREKEQVNLAAEIPPRRVWKQAVRNGRRRLPEGEGVMYDAPDPTLVEQELSRRLERPVKRRGDYC